MISRFEWLLQVLGFGLFAAKFLSLGAILGSSTVLLGLQLNVLVAATGPVAVFCLWVGWLAFARVRAVLQTPYY
ncbi:MAG: hypothetical protein WC273_09025 [Dehalococcoidia bacterium]